MFKKISYVVLFVLWTIILSGQKKQIDYILDTKASDLTWIGSGAMGAYTLSGSVLCESGQLSVLKNKIVSSELLVDLTTIDHPQDQLVTHLKSDDFFNVKKYPFAAFSNLLPVDISFNENVEVRGLLNIKSHQREERFLFNTKEQNGRLIITFEVSFDRTDYDITFNSPSFFDNLKNQAISDEIRLNGYLVFYRKS